MGAGRGARATATSATDLRWTGRLDPGAAIARRARDRRGASGRATSRRRATAIRADRSLPAEQWVDTGRRVPGRRRQDRVRATHASASTTTSPTSCSNAASASGRRRRRWCASTHWSRATRRTGVTVRFASTPADIAAYARIVAEAFAHLMLPGGHLARRDRPSRRVPRRRLRGRARRDRRRGRSRARRPCSFGGGEIALRRAGSRAPTPRAAGVSATPSPVPSPTRRSARGANLVTLEASHVRRAHVRAHGLPRDLPLPDAAPPLSDAALLQVAGLVGGDHPRRVRRRSPGRRSAGTAASARICSTSDALEVALAR